MKRAFISLTVACLVAALTYLALPDETNAEKAAHVIVLVFVGAVVGILVALRLWPVK
jgi:uncharacterized membrane protein YgaE (UPF0421/DUF939 family)